MPAAPDGTTVMTLCNGVGTPIVVVTLSWVPGTGVFNNPAVRVVNSAGKNVSTIAYEPNGTPHLVTVPNGTTNVTPAQMTAFGITNHSLLNGVSVALA